MKHLLTIPVAMAALCLCATAADRVKTENGVLESNTPKGAAVRSFKGIPYGQPPVNDLRWKEPQPVKHWKGARNADKFGPACMQRLSPMADYWLRGQGMSEDCLYLNVWTPAKTNREHLPVMVYIFGGGFQNGDGSEPRYDGANMAAKGIVAVSINYRTNVFGFFVHPELTAESPHHASGNYGFLDQVAALRWVQQNIAAFGGDPSKVTVAGESAGSISVSALMASPLSRSMMAGAIGESGSLTSTLPPRPLATAEADGVKFAKAVGADSLAALRAMSGQQILDSLGKSQGVRFAPVLDGYFLAKPITEIFAAGEQAKVPLLAGSNSEEQPARMVLGQNEPTPENFAAAIKRLYPEHADEVLRVYAPATPEEVLSAATQLASARFVGESTWKWTELQMETGGQPVYRYLYSRIRPKYTPLNPPAIDATAAQVSAGRGGPPSKPRGAAHSSEIQYVMGNLDLDTRYAWDADDHKVSQTMQTYFVNFIKTGDPNGSGLPDWPAYSPKTGYQRMHIDVDSRAEPESDRARYQVLDSITASPGRTY